jgi:predicted RNA-binding protein with TRAM domain
MSYVNRFERGSTYPQREDERSSNAGGRRREEGRGDFGRKKPVELGKEYDVEIVEKSRREDGIARIDNFVIFVRKGVVGEKVRIKIESVSPSFAIASIVQPASSNAEPAAVS